MSYPCYTLTIRFVNLLQLSSESELRQPSATELKDEIDELKELIRSLTTKVNDTNQCISELKSFASEDGEHVASSEMSSEPLVNQQQLTDVTIHRSDEEEAAAAVSQHVSSDQQPSSSKSVQTERSAVLEDELIRQFTTREERMNQHIQMLQDELEKRSIEAVVSAAKLRRREDESPSTQQQQQLDDEPKYKGKNL